MKNGSVTKSDLENKYVFWDIDMSHTVEMSEMFYGCESLTEKCKSELEI